MSDADEIVCEICGDEADNTHPCEQCDWSMGECCDSGTGICTTCERENED